jgi:hypothetical protein
MGSDVKGTSKQNGANGASSDGVDLGPLCPFCGYSRRGIGSTACPECGGLAQYDDQGRPLLRSHLTSWERREDGPALWRFLRTVVEAVCFPRFLDRLKTRDQIPFAHPGKFLLLVGLNLLALALIAWNASPFFVGLWRYGSVDAAVRLLIRVSRGGGFYNVVSLLHDVIEIGALLFSSSVILFVATRIEKRVQLGLAGLTAVLAGMTLGYWGIAELVRCAGTVLITVRGGEPTFVYFLYWFRIGLCPVALWGIGVRGLGLPRWRMLVATAVALGAGWVWVGTLTEIYVIVVLNH